MKSIELVYNEIYKQFEITALISIKGQSPISEKFVIDSGSPYTSLSEEIVSKFENVKELPQTTVYGISGPAIARIVEDVNIIIDTSTLKSLHFDSTVVNEVQEKKVKAPKDRRLEHRQVIKYPVPSIIGLDLIEKLKGKLILDLGSHIGAIEY